MGGSQKFKKRPYVTFFYDRFPSSIWSPKDSKTSFAEKKNKKKKKGEKWKNSLSNW